MGSLNVNESSYMAERAQQNVHKVNALQQELGEECKEIQQRVVTIRNKILDNKGSSQNFNGFLLGSVNEYMYEFDAQIDKLNRRLNVDKKFWTDKVA